MNRIPLNGKQLTLVVIGAIASLALGWGACGNTPDTTQEPKSRKNKNKKTSSIDTNRKDSSQAKNNAKTTIGALLS